MGMAWSVSEIMKHLLSSRLKAVRPWMKVKVNIINTWCITMSGEVTLPSLMTMTSMVSEESPARDTHTDTETDRRTFASSILNIFKVVSDFENKKEKEKICWREALVVSSIKFMQEPDDWKLWQAYRKLCRLLRSNKSHNVNRSDSLSGWFFCVQENRFKLSLAPIYVSLGHFRGGSVQKGLTHIYLL